MPKKTINTRLNAGQFRGWALDRTWDAERWNEQWILDRTWEVEQDARRLHRTLPSTYTLEAGQHAVLTTSALEELKNILFITYLQSTRTLLAISLWANYKSHIYSF